jgi:hypothetical protein
LTAEAPEADKKGAATEVAAPFFQAEKNWIKEP